MDRTAYFIGLPRSGLHLTVDIIHYIACNLQLARRHINKLFIYKNNDFDNDIPIDCEKTYIVFYRNDPLKEIEAWYRFCNKTNYDIDAITTFYQEHIEYYNKFMKKWVENEYQNILKIEYDKLVSHPTIVLTRVLDFIHGPHSIPEDIIQKAVCDYDIPNQNEINNVLYQTLKRRIQSLEQDQSQNPSLPPSSSPPPIALITGGCGFVGRNFCKRLVDEGYYVVCVDNLISSSSLHPFNWPVHLRCDIHSLNFIHQDCRTFFKDTRYYREQYDLVIHLAAVVEGRKMIEENPIAIAQDLSIDAQFFEWLVRLNNKPNKIVCFSSSAAYPIKYQANDELQTTLSEDMITFEKDIGMPDVTYGWSKLTCEYLARLAHEKHGFDIVCYRPFSGYGSDQHESYPFPAILKRIVNKEDPIEIWSDTVRDFVHIDDVVNCVLATMGKISDASALNIGTGIATSFSQLVEMMCKVSGHQANTKILDDQPKGVMYRVADTHILKENGWSHSISLEDGINMALVQRYNFKM